MQLNDLPGLAVQNYFCFVLGSASGRTFEGGRTQSRMNIEIHPAL
jgi:hypothetical protein